MTAVRKIKTPVPHLRVVKGGKSNPKNKILENTWNFIHAALWNDSEFSYKEKIQFQKLLSEHYDDYYSLNWNIENIFGHFIQRVCLVKRYVNRKRGRYIAKPIDWLNYNYYAGFAGTHDWFKEVSFQRLTVPNYNYGIKLLAEAIIKYLQEPTIETIVTYRKKLIAEKQFDLLQIFNNAIINFQINE